MKALQISRNGAAAPTLSLVTAAKPTLAPGFALVKIRFSSIQPSDKLNARGGFPATTFPRIPGRDFSGEVVEASPAAAAWVGKQVYGTSDDQLGFTIDGAHAQFALIPEAMLVEQPAALTACQAAIVGVAFTTALMCLERARTAPADTVLVLGSTGQVGSAAVQIAKALGCHTVLAASRHPDADVVISSPGPTVAEQVAQATGGKGADVIVDTVGDTDLMAAAIPSLAPRGRYTWIAAPRNGRPTTLLLDIFQAYRQEIELLGCNSAHTNAAEVGQKMLRLQQLFDAGKLAGPSVSDIQVVKLDDAIADGYQAQKAKKHTVIEMD